MKTGTALTSTHQGPGQYHGAETICIYAQIITDETLLASAEATEDTTLN